MSRGPEIINAQNNPEGSLSAYFFRIYHATLNTQCYMNGSIIHSSRFCLAPQVMVGFLPNQGGCAKQSQTTGNYQPRNVQEFSATLIRC
jgi:hypothetical protein